MRNKGFTLVEILVVVVIMAIMISLAVLSIGVTGRDSELDQESRRIVGLMGLLHDRALLEGRDFGLLVGPHSYEFLAYDGLRDQWRPLRGEGEFRRRQLPKGMSFALNLDARDVVLKAADPNLATDAETAAAAPQVAIAASGDGTPFRLTLLRDSTQAKAVIEGDAMGRTTLAGAAPPEKSKS